MVGKTLKRKQPTKNTILIFLICISTIFMSIGYATINSVTLNIDSYDSYLNNETVWWTMSPGFVSATGVYNGVIHSMLDHVAPNYTSSISGGVRPVISLKPNTIIKSGIGTQTSPFIIE